MSNVSASKRENLIKVENIFGETVEVPDNPLLRLVISKGGKYTGIDNYDREKAAENCLESLKKLQLSN